MGGTAAVTYSVDPGSSAASASPSASALAQLQTTEPGAAPQLANELTLLQSPSSSGTESGIAK
jgi:hypothetical protein